MRDGQGDLSGLWEAMSKRLGLLALFALLGALLALLDIATDHGNLTTADLRWLAEVKRRQGTPIPITSPLG